MEYKNYYTDDKLEIIREAFTAAITALELDAEYEIDVVHTKLIESGDFVEVEVYFPDSDEVYDMYLHEMGDFSKSLQDFKFKRMLKQTVAVFVDNLTKGNYDYKKSNEYYTEDEDNYFDDTFDCGCCRCCGCSCNMYDDDYYDDEEFLG